MVNKERKLRETKKKYIDSMLDIDPKYIESCDETFWEQLSASDERDEQTCKKKRKSQ
jgi:hypothetical protein